ncbi:MAG: 50S ribosomal protein L23 [bacterium]
MGIFDKLKKTASDDDQKQPAVSEINVEKKVVKEETTKAVAVKKSVDGKQIKPVYGILVRALITEKSTDLSQFNKYVFLVASSANKITIAKAIESRYGVKPESVNIIRNEGKATRYGKTMGKTKDTKKAIISLPKGKTIKINEDL